MHPTWRYWLAESEDDSPVDALKANLDEALKHLKSLTRSVRETVSKMEGRDGYPRIVELTDHASRCILTFLAVLVRFSIRSVYLVLVHFLRSFREITPDLKELAGEYLAQLSISSFFAIFLVAWFMFSLYGSLALGAVCLLQLFGIFFLLVVVLLNSVVKIVSWFSVHPIAVITGFAAFPLFLLGSPAGLLVALLLAVLAIGYDLHSLARSLGRSLRKTARLMLTPILVYILVAEIGGFADIGTDLAVFDALKEDVEGFKNLASISTEFHESENMFVTDYGSEEFSVAIRSVSDIDNYSVAFEESLSNAVKHAEKAIELLAGHKGLAVDTVRSSSLAIIDTSNLIRQWLDGSRLCSSLLHTGAGDSSKNYANVEQAIANLSETKENLTGHLGQPFGVDFFDAIRGIASTIDYLIDQLEWCVIYKESLFLESTVSSLYHNDTDSLVFNVSVSNRGSLPVNVSDPKVALDIYWLDWMNFEGFPSLHEACPLQTNISIPPSTLVLEPQHDMILTITFERVNETLSRYVHDFRSFSPQVVIIHFGKVYIQFNVEEAFSATR